MAKPGKYDFTIYQGATFTRNLHYKDSNGDTVDLSAYTARLKAKKDKSDSTAVLDIDTDTEITLSDANPNIVIALTATATAALDFDTAFYDLELVSGSTVTRLLEGVITLSKEVTD